MCVLSGTWNSTARDGELVEWGLLHWKLVRTTRQGTQRWIPAVFFPLEDGTDCNFTTVLQFTCSVKRELPVATRRRLRWLTGSTRSKQRHWLRTTVDNSTPSGVHSFTNCACVYFIKFPLPCEALESCSSYETKVRRSHWGYDCIDHPSK